VNPLGILQQGMARVDVQVLAKNEAVETADQWAG
jgi:hypothetical protein